MNKQQLLQEIMTKKCLLGKPDKKGNRPKYSISDFFGNFEIEELIEGAFKEIESETIKQTEKAFGGCKKCYGKGYGTYRFGYRESSDFPDHEPIKHYEDPITTHMLFCTCDRGKQLKSLLKGQNEKE